MITGIIMASGFSNRMGKNKLLLNINGKPIIKWVIEAIEKSNIDNIILVYNNEKVKDLCSEKNIKFVYNSKPHFGQSQSLKLGVINSPKESQAFMFFVADQPFINPSTINRIIDTYTKTKSEIVVPLYNNKKGNPVIFSSEFRNTLMKIEGDKGGREIIKKNKGKVCFVSIDNHIIGKDIDTWDEYQCYKEGR